MISFLVALILVPSLIFFIGLLPWPDLPVGVTTGLVQVFGYIWSFNQVFPIDTMIQVSFIALTIELSIFAIKTYLWVTGHYTHHNSNLDQKK